MMTKALYRVSLALAAGTALAAAPAQALNINLIDIGGVSGSPAEQGFSIAAKYWESVFTNNATVNLNVGFSPLGPGILGSTGSNLATFVPIADYYGALAATGTSALDAAAVANLSPLSSTGSVRIQVPGYTSPGLGIDVSGTRIAPDGVEISNTMALTTANLRAFGVDLGSTIDAEIQFSSDFSFDFNPSDGIANGSYDFIGVAIHEIGHALGFVSGVDDFDYFNGYNGPVDDAWWAYALDLFKYGPDAAGNPVLDLEPGDASYFSIDGGATAYGGGFFSTGAFNGDGSQGSHWKAPGDCGVFLGIMNPYICNGKTDSVTGLDLAAFDAIGWNLADSVRDKLGYTETTGQIYTALTAVPEVATWVQMVLGFGLFGLVLRRRAAKVQVSFS